MREEIIPNKATYEIKIIDNSFWTKIKLLWRINYLHVEPQILSKSKYAETEQWYQVNCKHLSWYKLQS